MAEIKEARVPDIGDYSDVPVIEVLVAVGDTVSQDQGLVTLESDKATLEVPSPFSGVVRELKVKLGDSLSEGAVVAMIEVEGAAAPAPATRSAASRRKPPRRWKKWRRPWTRSTAARGRWARSSACSRQPAVQPGSSAELFPGFFP